MLKSTESKWKTDIKSSRHEQSIANQQLAKLIKMSYLIWNYFIFSGGKKNLCALPVSYRAKSPQNETEK